MIRTIAFTLLIATYCFPLLARSSSVQTAEKLIIYTSKVGKKAMVKNLRSHFQTMLNL